MLVKFTDTEGRETWINAMHVKVVRAAKRLLGGVKGSEIWFSWNSTSESINVRNTPDEVASALSAVMPPWMPPPMIFDTDDDSPADGKTSD